MNLRKTKYLFAVGFVCLVLATVMMAQVKTETTTTPGQPTVETQVERGEVVYVSGNDLVVKMEDGQIRNFQNVPDDVKVTVEGKELSVHELKPGMKLERTITTTNTPQTVTTVHTVTGRVVHVTPPNSVILALEDGTNQKFSIPPGQKFNVDGQETDAFGLRKGMRISATKVVTAPENVVTEQRKITGQMPPPPSTEAMQGPLLIVVTAAPATEAAKTEPEQAQAAAPTMPQTASQLPLIALIGMLMLLSGVLSLAAFWSRVH
jgi:hypothetical protein